jgi:Ca-activated chloride channel family protein
MRFQPLQALAGTVALALTLSMGACTAQRHEPDAVSVNEPSRLSETLPGVKPEKDETQMKPRDSALSLEEVVITGSDNRTQQRGSPTPVGVTTRVKSAKERPNASAVEPPLAVAPGKSESYHIGSIAPAPIHAPSIQPETNTEQYDHVAENPVHVALDSPVSTFSIDVDTGAYANVRRFLNAGALPPADAVRVEEMINYFDYDYAPPDSRATPFKVHTETSQAPWNPEHLLLRIGIKGYDVPAAERPAANLVFLIDVSGSMNSPDKLPLLQNAFKLLTQQLSARDSVSIAVYAGSSGVVLQPTHGDQHAKILGAIERLQAGGATNGGAGIALAYRLAREAFIPGGINRVVLATDGDFNVGTVSFEALIDMAAQQRASGIAITTLGFGTGNYNDKLMERLADAGNGNYAYVDSLQEARKVLVTELSATLLTIAKDVKIQVEFNPANVREYRLIGYENRKLQREDFSNDKVDAGDIGAGHRVTAIYEIVPVDARGLVEPLRYGTAHKEPAQRNDELAFVRLRYKLPDADASQLLAYPIVRSAIVANDKTSDDFRFAASVAAFGQLLRGGKYLGAYAHDDIVQLARGALSADGEGHRREFVSLVKLADSLAPKATQRVGNLSR